MFSIIYYGFGDANRYAYYSKVEKIRQVFLSKVRNQNGLNEKNSKRCRPTNWSR